MGAFQNQATLDQQLHFYTTRGLCIGMARNSSNYTRLHMWKNNLNKSQVYAQNYTYAQVIKETPGSQSKCPLENLYNSVSKWF